MTYAVERAPTVGTSSGLLVSPSPKREALWLSVPPGARVSISQFSPAVLGNGITLNNSTSPLRL